MKRVKLTRVIWICSVRLFTLWVSWGGGEREREKIGRRGANFDQLPRFSQNVPPTLFCRELPPNIFRERKNHALCEQNREERFSSVIFKQQCADSRRNTLSHSHSTCRFLLDDYCLQMKLWWFHYTVQIQANKRESPFWDSTPSVHTGHLIIMSKLRLVNVRVRSETVHAVSTPVISL